MKTVYLIKANGTNTNFGCDERLGLIFVESVIDVTFLNNVTIDDDLKLFVQQDVKPDRVGKPVFWYLFLINEQPNNASLERVWKRTKRIANSLHKYTQLGQNLTYKNVWTFPNISDDWILQGMSINFAKHGQFENIYFDDQSKPMIEIDGQMGRECETANINADFVFCIGSPTSLTQSHFAHIAIPGKHDIDASEFYRNNDVLNDLRENGLKLTDKDSDYLMELYNRAISSNDIFSSFLTMFQMIEVIIRSSKSTKLSLEEITKISEFIDSDPNLSISADRIIGSIKNLPVETSKELLLQGLNYFVGEKNSHKLDINNFPKWRKMRGALTHPSKAAELTEKQFVEQYKTLRTFCKKVIELTQF